MKYYPYDKNAQSNRGWLNAHHAFSFGNYMNQNRMQSGPVQVINYDKIAVGGGFAPHSHQDMEIITYVLNGTLSHQDNLNNNAIIPTGAWQYMSAGTGITHSEMNRHDESIRLLQIWIKPNELNLTPQYQENLTPLHVYNEWQLRVCSSVENLDSNVFNISNILKINQNAQIWEYKSNVDDEVNFEIALNEKIVHQHLEYLVYVIDGEITISVYSDLKVIKAQEMLVLSGKELLNMFETGMLISETGHILLFAYEN